MVIDEEKKVEKHCHARARKYIFTSKCGI